MQEMIDNLDSSMRLLVASVRAPQDIVALASQVVSELCHCTTVNHVL
jgi:hypothetical protein